MWSLVVVNPLFLFTINVIDEQAIIVGMFDHYYDINNLDQNRFAPLKIYFGSPMSNLF
jgi:hypothetical protein